jgi:hypothetical protein
MWPFKHASRSFCSWPIVRTQPFGRTYGKAILLFINNWQCHLTAVDVYADGVVDCWGFVDLIRFEHKLKARWIVAAPKKDQPISVFNLGQATALETKWYHTPEDIAPEVMRTLKTLNPGLTGLFDIQRHTRAEQSQGRSARIGPSDRQPFRSAGPAEREILGDSVPAFRVCEGQYEIIQLFIFSDGMVQLGTNGPLLPLTSLEERFQSGELAPVAPPRSRITIPGLGEFTTGEQLGEPTTAARIAELQDKLKVLNGEPSVVTLCIRAFEDYLQKPSAGLKEGLRLAYEKVPEHLRKYCGNMDTKDTAIRRILLGAEPTRDALLSLPFDKG